MVEGQLVCIAAKEDMIVAILSRAPYIETNEKALECSFRSLEFVNVVYVGEGSKIPVPKLSETTQLVVKQVAEKEPEMKRLRKRTTRHAKANHCNLEK